MPKKTQPGNTHTFEALMRYARMLGFGDIHTKVDAKTGLHAIIAIHNTSRGPALGGTRFYRYKTAGHALKDVLSLSFMMTLKAAISGLPHGGGKSVIIMPPVVKDRNALFRSFGDFVHEQNGRYIAAIDVGTTTDDMDIVAKRTPYVIGAASVHVGHGNPAEHTALGVFRGIEAAIQFKLNRTNLKDIHIAIQGAGQVGYSLASLLKQHGAQVSICDINDAAAQQAADDFSVNCVHADDIYDVECDVFAPCALGGTINLDTISRLRCQIIAGSANNQLAHKKIGEVLMEKGILYAPDFLVNSGGLINAALVYDSADEVLAKQHILTLYDTCLELFERAAREKRPTTEVAEQIAWEKLG